MRTDTQRKSDVKIGPPPKKWRNWYVVVLPFKCTRTKRSLLPGEVFAGTEIHPSKEIAEQSALKCIGDPRYATGVGYARYLGAEPEE